MEQLVNQLVEIVLILVAAAFAILAGIRELKLGQAPDMGWRRTAGKVLIAVGLALFGFWIFRLVRFP